MKIHVKVSFPIILNFDDDLFKDISKSYCNRFNLFSLIEVCLDLTLKTSVHYWPYYSNWSWSFGNCDAISNANNYTIPPYEGGKEYNQTCCFNTSPDNWVFELKCLSFKPYGWKEGFITVDGKKYCDNFPSGVLMTAYVEKNPCKYYSS